MRPAHSSQFAWIGWEFWAGGKTLLINHGSNAALTKTFCINFSAWPVDKVQIQIQIQMQIQIQTQTQIQNKYNYKYKTNKKLIPIQIQCSSNTNIMQIQNMNKCNKRRMQIWNREITTHKLKYKLQYQGCNTNTTGLQYK